MDPAISTCDMTHPPNMSPAWLVSAGIAATLNIGILFKGNIWSGISVLLRRQKRFINC
jgi:hypothetical protein